MPRSIARAAALVACLFAAAFLLPRAADAGPDGGAPTGDGILPTEKLPGSGVWVDPAFEGAFARAGRVRATVWFEDQFLGDGGAYRRRAQEFAQSKRTVLRAAVVKTLKAIADSSWAAAEQDLAAQTASGGVRAIDRFWIVNGFSCGVTAAGLEALKKVPGVRKIFVDTAWSAAPRAQPGESPAFPPAAAAPFDPARYKHPWYVRYLLADRVWKELGVTGKDTLNVIHDHNFFFSDNTTRNAYRNPGEIPGNGRDDDGNGLIDDYHGFNFDWNSPVLTTDPVPAGGGTGPQLHGFNCSAIVCGSGSPGHEFEFGVAPEGTWAGVISSGRMEAAVQWAIERGADTYSMSFSAPDRGEFRSHWRKLMEQGSFCGVCFVSGAGNFGQEAKVPVQMRQPEDIPDAVFAAAGVHRDLTRTATSSRGPVEWKTEHYRDGTVPKPEVCAFNYGLPCLFRDGTVRDVGINGNSFAGPMFCGSIALMFSADPDLLPWDLREIITSTATDVAAEGVDDETGHGLINCYRAVREVLRRKAAREGRSTAPYTGRVPGDELDVVALRERLKVVAVGVDMVAPDGQAAALGIHPGDVIVSLGGAPTGSQTELQKQLAARRSAGQADVPMVLRRGDQTLEIKLRPGPLGLRATDRYAEPEFE